MADLDMKSLKPYSSATSRLEPEYETAFTQWKTTPDKHSTGELLRQLNPAIDKAIQTHVGPPHPLIRSRARSHVMKVLPAYDRNQSSLNTYVMNQLYSLRRINRQQSQIISAPERWAHEAVTLSREEDHLRELLGRDPTTSELADRAGISLKRIAKIRAYNQPVSEGQFESAAGSQYGRTAYTPQVQGDDDRWADIVYLDLDPVDQKIMEHTLGLYGQPVLRNQQLAGKLGLSPGAVSQRKAKIQAKLNESVQVF